MRVRLNALSIRRQVLTSGRLSWGHCWTFAMRQCWYLDYHSKRFRGGEKASVVSEIVVTD